MCRRRWAPPTPGVTFDLGHVLVLVWEEPREHVVPVNEGDYLGGLGHTVRLRDRLHGGERIGEAICKAQNEQLLYVHKDSQQPETVSIKRALEMCLDSTPDLEGFLALTDSITELIMNAPDSDQGSSDGNSSLSQAKGILKKLDKRDIPHILAVDRKPSGVTVTKDELREELNAGTTGRSQVLESDVFVKELSIPYDSEERRPTGNETTSNQKNPVNFVYFYRKETPWKAQTGREYFKEAAGQSLSPTQSLSVHELPETTDVKEMRVYGHDRKRKRDVQEAYRKVKHCKETE